MIYHSKDTAFRIQLLNNLIIIHCKSIMLALLAALFEWIDSKPLVHVYY